MTAPIRISNFARLGAWILVLWGWFGLTSSLTSQAWLFTVGFWPVWYGECVLCAGPNVVANSVPFVGGTGLFAVVAIVTAVLLLARLFPLRIQVWIQIVGGLAGIGHSALAFLERYPGPLPQLLVGTLPSLVAAALFFMATFSAPAAAVSSFTTSVPARAARWYLAVALLSQLLLGGVITVISIALGIRAYRVRESMSDSVFLLAGTIHTLIGMGAYYAVYNRFALEISNPITWIF